MQNYIYFETCNLIAALMPAKLDSNIVGWLVLKFKMDVTDSSYGCRVDFIYMQFIIIQYFVMKNVIEEGKNYSGENMITSFSPMFLMLHLLLVFFIH